MQTPRAIQPWLLFGWVIGAGLLFRAGSSCQPSSAAKTSSTLPAIRIDDERPEENAAVSENKEEKKRLADLGVPRWHRDGYRGQGVTVAILDSGFRGYRRALGSALPQRVEVRSFRRDGKLEARDSQHGILCAEIVHKIAPAARVLLANWEPGAPEAFLNAVRWARGRGARVICCSVIMPTWSDGEGGGTTHNALARALASDDVGDGLFVACAGNTAQRHWGGPISPGPNGWHQWEEGQYDNVIRPYGTDRVSVELTAPAGPAYELIVRDCASGREVGRSSSVVRFDPLVRHRYAVRLRLIRPGSSQRHHFHLTVLGGRLGISTAAGSVPFPGDGAAVVAVGALDEEGRTMAYSSRGPNGPGPKPDLNATVPFPSRWRPEQPFSGTSAAAPQAAGLAALVWGRRPEWTARQVREALRRAADPIGKRVRLP